MVKVLLLDGQTVQCVSVSKALKSIKNVYVTVFCEEIISFGNTSKYPDQKVICPRLNNSPVVFLNFLFDYLEKKPQDLIIPLFNDSAELLSKNKLIIEGFGVKISVPNYDIFIKAHNKELLMEMCKQNNIPHPKTASLTKMCLEDAVKYVGFPSLIKPNISAGAKGIKFVYDLCELNEKYISVYKEFGESTLQEYINHSGIYFNAMIYRYKNGEYSQAVIIKILRYFPIKGGTSSYCEIIENNEILQICKKTLNCLDWRGFADFDFIQDVNSDEYKLIEINPRFPSSIHAAFVSGLNFPQIMIWDFLNEAKLPDIKFKVGQKLRFFSLDVLWFMFSKNRFQSKPSWFKFFDEDLHFQDGSFLDPLPLFAGIFQGVFKYLNPKFRRAKFNS